VHDLGVRAAFERVQADLGHDGIRFDHVVLHQAVQSTIAHSLLDYAEGMRSDLIAAGSIRRGRFDRWLMGSVSTDLVRDGSRSVLITPPPRVGSG
jgi:nucleotide-binding universal stress UspA family protein